MNTGSGKVGLVAGAFDLIHPGYIQLLKDAKRVCDWLIVALHEDPSLERPNQKFAPVFSREERADILMAIRYVDEVRYYRTEDELAGLILEIRPDIRILGDDYIGAAHVTGRINIPIYYHQRTSDWSNTRVRQLITKQMKGRMQ